MDGRIRSVGGDGDEESRGGSGGHSYRSSKLVVVLAVYVIIIMGRNCLRNLPQAIYVVRVQRT